MDRLPSTFTQGDTLESWTESVSDFPASGGYSLVYALAGPQLIEIESTADGDDYAFNSVQAKTSNTPWTAGIYEYQRVIYQGDTKIRTLEKGRVEILEDLALIEGEYNAASFAKQMLDACEALLLGRATKKQKALVVDGQQLEYLSPAELRVEYHKWKTAYEAERKDEARKQNSNLDDLIRVHFT